MSGAYLLHLMYYGGDVRHIELLQELNKKINISMLVRFTMTANEKFKNFSRSHFRVIRQNVNIVTNEKVNCRLTCLLQRSHICCP